MNEFQLKSSVRTLLTAVLFLALSVVARAGEIAYSNYDVPLFEQVTNRIKDKVSARLGEERTRAIVFSSFLSLTKTRRMNLKFAHSFLSVIRVFADDKQPHITSGLKLRKYKNREFEAFHHQLAAQ
jgi:hypothetical protein